MTQIAVTTISVGEPVMCKTLPAFKLQPSTIPLGRLLEVIEVNAGDYQRMQDALYSLWLQSSRRIRMPDKRNSLRAVIGPSLRHLALVRGEATSLRLTGVGKRIYEAYLKGGELGLRKELATHLIRMDETNWIGVLSRLKDAGGQMDFSSLFEAVGSDLDEREVTTDKLRKYLRFFEYAELISLRSGSIRLNEKRLTAVRVKYLPNMSQYEFTRILQEAYSKLKPADGGPFVSIPDIRDKVCERTGLFSDDFDARLKQTPRETKDYVLQFSQPMIRQQGGLLVGNTYFYYLAIYPRRQANERL